MQRAKPAELREACIGEAFRIIEQSGLENLSLREVARRLHVSHQAPYKHFPSRDHILAEVIARCFEQFAIFLETPPDGEGSAEWNGMGARYLEYARRHPLQYRLMFNTPLPDPTRHPGMMQKAQQAFSLLHCAIEAMQVGPLADGNRPPADHDALFVWATLHGVASILQSDALRTLQMSDEEIGRAVQVCMARISAALRI